MKRKIVDVKVDDCYVDLYDIIDGRTPASIIEVMTHYQQRFAGRDVYFDIESYGYDGGKELVLRERREETDREYYKRLEQEQKIKEKIKKTKAQKEAKDLAEYERLKKKFEVQP